MKRRNELSEDLGRLDKIGLELESPQDEFSYQPDSGSTIGGLRGKDEYGIDDSEDEKESLEDQYSVVGTDEEESDTVTDIHTADKTSAGVSEYSLSHTDPEDVKTHQGSQKSLDKIRNLLDIRLKHIPILAHQNVLVSLHGDKLVMEGKLETEAQKMQAEEVAEAVCGNIEVESKLIVHNMHTAARCQ